jgi:hypothetical protein
VATWSCSDRFSLAEHSYGLTVVWTDDKAALREFAERDLVARTRTAAFDFWRMAAGHARGAYLGCEVAPRVDAAYISS